MKRETSDPKGRLRDLSREAAQKAIDPRGMHPVKRDGDRGGQRRQEHRHRGGFSPVCGSIGDSA